MNLATVTSTVATYTSHVPLDWAIVAVLIIGIALMSLKPGSMHAMTALFALPLAYLLNTLLPAAFLIGAPTQSLSFPYAHAILFFTLFVIAYLFVMRISASFSTLGGIIEAILSSVSVTIMLLVIWQTVPVLAAAWHFGPAISGAFAEAYRLWWVILSLLLLAFARS